MGDSDGHKRSRHAGQEHRRALLDSHQGQAGLELLAAVAHEARPMVGAGNDLLQIGNHLAAVAHAEREGVLAGKEAFEFGARSRAVQDGLGPTFAGAQDVAVGKPAAGRDAAESSELDAAGEDVAHVDVDRLEACPVEGGGHFDLTVHALLAQDGHARPRPARDEGQRRRRPGHRSLAA